MFSGVCVCSTYPLYNFGSMAHDSLPATFSSANVHKFSDWSISSPIIKQHQQSTKNDKHPQNLGIWNIFVLFSLRISDGCRVCANVDIYSYCKRRVTWIAKTAVLEKKQPQFVFFFTKKCHSVLEQQRAKSSNFLCEQFKVNRVFICAKYPHPPIVLRLRRTFTFTAYNKKASKFVLSR